MVNLKKEWADFKGSLFKLHWGGRLFLGLFLGGAETLIVLLRYAEPLEVGDPLLEGLVIAMGDVVVITIGFFFLTFAILGIGPQQKGDTK